MVKVKKSPTVRKRKKSVFSYPSPMENVAGKLEFTVEAQAAIADITARVNTLKDLFFSRPEVLAEVGEIAKIVTEKFGQNLSLEGFQKLASSTLTPEILQLGLNQMAETFKELGRNEIREKYALEELAGIADEWGVPPVLPGFGSPSDPNFVPLDADFEEA